MTIATLEQMVDEARRLGPVPVAVAGAEDPKVPEHVGFISTPTVEDAIAEAERIHGRDCSIVCVEQVLG